jgi:hypothetical protein
MTRNIAAAVILLTVALIGLTQTGCHSDPHDTHISTSVGAPH